ncbi:2Fe-2S iron-sulfur cluster-binding protein [Sulfurimonas sp.]|uniref:succinate dehydrogenase/fumarate reductase iron-sulfur subunit n=1 Tax=Sulfurimonas sp. TaxID=2022749 RepID=UPI002635B1DF|nr:2Fe-2S iron-sulfur cluster-binding protein [Sulfurimonas sp.]
MKVSIQREFDFIEYDVDMSDATLLEVLNKIKIDQDSSLAYSSGCRSSVCGSCAVRVNGKEVLACSYKVKEGDSIEPLKNVPLIRDLVVDMDKALETNRRAKAWMKECDTSAQLTPENEFVNALQSDCILCGSCYSACPVYSLNEAFLGPFALTRVWKYVSDKRELDTTEKLETIQTNGVWDCTLCNECTLVCPQGISSKADIEKLRMKSTMAGYTDPNFANSFGGGFSFDGSPSF